MSESHPEEQVTHAQKAGVVLLVLFAVLVVALGTLQFRSTIYGPFVTTRATETEQNVDIARLLEDDEVRLQRIDTDQDGLTDFEELTFYETSPYIPDTDSDGISDATEVEDGTDPNCPVGEDCAGSSATSVEAGNGAAGNFENPLFDSFEDPLGTAPDALAPTSSTTPSLDTLNTEDRLSVLSIASDPDALRDLLRGNTELTDEQIDNLSDEFILEIAAEILAE